MSAVLKKIDASQLRVGMYIHDLSCDWMTHPFIRNRFLVTTDEEVRKVLTAGIHDVIIDTSKGEDVPGSPTLHEAALQIEHAIDKAMQQGAAPKRNFKDEIARAAKIREQACTVVKGIMSDVRLGRALSVDAVAPVVEEITASILRNPGALLGLLQIKSKDDYTFLHSVSVCALLVSFCHHRGFDTETTRLAGIGALLHDIGKATIPDNILNKPGRLSEQEFDIIRTHPRAGYEILKQSRLVDDIALDITLHHHERCDGSGYPEKLADAQISELAQMTAIVDVYDALTADRCYHEAMPAATALRKLFEWSKFHFRAELVQDFMRCVGIYPIGTLVRLASGKLAVVFEPSSGKPLLPKVNAFFQSKTNLYIKPEIIDLSRAPFLGVEKIISHESPKKWNLDPLKFLPA